MFLKLILRNCIRNIQTYLVYFLTLILIYSTLYGFNSISRHPTLQGMDNIKKTMANIMGQYMGILSFVVILAISFLVLYVSNFVIQRRKKELGLYGSLGMKNSRIILILFTEALFINLISLFIGLLIGLLFLVLLAKVALIIFDISYNGTLFYLDYRSIFLLLVTFLINSIIVGILNYLNFKNKNLISLIQNSSEQNDIFISVEDNRVAKLIIFLIVSVIIILSIIYLSDYNNLVAILDWGYLLVPLLIIFLFTFYNLIGQVIILLFSKLSSSYYLNLNSYKLRFWAKNIYQNSITIAVLSITLTLAFSIIIIGGSTYSSVKSELSKSTPYNLTVIHSLESSADKTDILKVLSDENINLKNSITSGHQVTVYESDVYYKDIIDTDNLWSIDSNLPNQKVSIISVSDFNALMKLQGKKELSLLGDEFAINCNYKGTLQQIKQFLKNNPIIILSDEELKYKELTSETYFISSVGNNDRGTIIVPDQVIDYLIPDTDIYVANYHSKANRTGITDYLTQWVENYSYQTEEGLVYEYQFQTSDRMKSIYMGFMGTIIFIMSFAGIVFTILTLSILSIQSSTTVLDTVGDYKILSYLGIAKTIIRKTVVQQNVMYFLVPCLIATPFSLAFGNSIINYLENFLNLPVGINLLYMGFMILLFVFYLLLTNYICIKIVEDKIA